MTTPVTPINIGSFITDPKIRKAIYITYGVVAFIAAAVTVAYGAGSILYPTWLVIANAVIGFIGAGVVTLGASNTPTDAKVAATVANANVVAAQTAPVIPSPTVTDPTAGIVSGE